MVRPVSALPAESRSVAVACVVCPAVSETDASATVIDATGAGGGGSTSTEDVAETPSTVALIEAVPARTAVTIPEVDTVAMVGLALDHCVTRCVREPPEASAPLDVSCAVLPTMSLTDDG